MVATTQLRLALEAEDERSAKKWNGFDLDLIWIEIGYSKISRNVLARPVMGTIFLVQKLGIMAEKKNWPLCKNVSHIMISKWGSWR